MGPDEEEGERWKGKEDQFLETQLCSGRRKCSSCRARSSPCPLSQPPFHPILSPSLSPSLDSDFLGPSHPQAVSPQAMGHWTLTTPERRTCPCPYGFSESEWPRKIWRSPAGVGRAPPTRSAWTGAPAAHLGPAPTRELGGGLEILTGDNTDFFYRELLKGFLGWLLATVEKVERGREQQVERWVGKSWRPGRADEGEGALSLRRSAVQSSSHTDVGCLSVGMGWTCL